MIWLLVALGAGTGTGLRWGAGRLLDGERWPSGTLLVNLVGSFLLGLFSALALDGAQLALLGTGLCGGLTTFSSWMVQTSSRGPRLGATHLTLTLVGSLALCWLGFVIGA